MIDPGNEMLIERVLHLRAKTEVDRLSSTRNALIARLRQRGVMQTLNDMSNEELQEMIGKIIKKKSK